jgi:hypothetical protein
MHNTFAAEWERFRAVVLPDVDPLQTNEMQKAFYAGGDSILHLLISIADNIEDEDEGAEAFGKYHDEIEQWIKSLLRK